MQALLNTAPRHGTLRVKQGPPHVSELHPLFCQTIHPAVMIRTATVSDASVIAQLNEQYFHEAGGDFAALISDPQSDMYVALEDQQIIAFTGLQANEWNQTLQVIDILVHPSFRRQGIGHQLVQYLIQVAEASKYRCLTAEAPSLNPVLQLYLRHGFQICGYHHRYYTNTGPEVAILFHWISILLNQDNFLSVLQWHSIPANPIIKTR